jgi:hypothetical protein
MPACVEGVACEAAPVEIFAQGGEFQHRLADSENKPVAS